MQVELGNSTPHEHFLDDGGALQQRPIDGPVVTSIWVPDSYTLEPDAQVHDLALHLAQNPDVTRLPDHEAFLAVAHPANGKWGRHSGGQGGPSWVWSDRDELARLLSEFYGCPVGRPGDVEDTHFTRSGPPGVGPDPYGGATMLKVNAGNDLQSRQMGGDVMGDTGTTSSGPTATTVTDSGKSWTTNAFIGHVVIMGGVYGVIVSNTATVLTIDRWYAPGTPGGAAGGTPATGVYTILPGTAPAMFVALTANASAPAAGDTTLTAEITTALGGLIRKICPYGHSAGAASFTLTPVFTANASDVLPVTIAKMGVFNSLLSGQLLFETLVSPTATLSASGDQLTLTETVSL